MFNKIKKLTRPGEINKQVKVLSAHPNALSVIPGTRRVE